MNENKCPICGGVMATIDTHSVDNISKPIGKAYLCQKCFAYFEIQSPPMVKKHDATSMVPTLLIKKSRRK